MGQPVTRLQNEETGSLVKSRHDDARYSADLIDAHVHTLIPIVYSPPRSGFGLKFFNLFRQTFLRDTSMFPDKDKPQ
jgi:hypothetical protein